MSQRNDCYSSSPPFSNCLGVMDWFTALCISLLRMTYRMIQCIEFTHCPLLIHVLNNHHLILCGQITHLLSSPKGIHSLKTAIPFPIE